MFTVAVINLQLLLLNSETPLQEMGSYVFQERGCKDIWSIQWTIILSSLFKMVSWPQSICRNTSLDLMSLKTGKSLLPIIRLRASLFILFDNVSMLHRSTGFKVDIFHFFIYSIPIVSLELYIHLLQNHWQNIQILQLFLKFYFCIYRIILDFSFFHNFAEM